MDFKNLGKQAQSTVGAGVSQRANALFEQHREFIFKRTDRMFAGLMLFQWLAAVVAACVISPRAWAGANSHIHLHVWMAVILGGLITMFPAALAFVMPGKPLTRHVIAIAQMLVSALLIHLSGGRIETHFHVFGSLAILAMYRDWRVLFSSTLVVAADHFLRGIYAPQSVYGILAPENWRWLEHAGWVVFEDVFLILSCVQSLREMRAIAVRQAQLEASNEIIEAGAEKLSESEARFRSLSEFSPTGIFQTDGADQIVYANDRCLAILGLKTSIGVAGGWRHSIHPEDRDEVAEKYHVARAARAEVADEFRLLLPNKQVSWAVLRARALLSDDGELTGYVGTLTDITERKQTEELMLQAKEQAETANEAKSMFLSRMSHELRTPLNSILGFGQLLEMSDRSADDRESISHIMKAGKHLLELINEVLDIARVESGKFTVSLEPVSVAEIVNEAVALMGPFAAQRSVRLHSDLDIVENQFIKADRQRFKQVCLNILSNAIKYNREGGSVTVSYGGVTNGTFSITFTDTGIGIRPEMMTRLFTPFDRLDTEASGIDGTGLGLSVSKSLVEAMMGQIRVESEPGIGSTFSVDLPLSDDPARNSAQVGEIEPGATHPDEVQARTVLYIEDNPANLRLVAAILERRPGITLVSALQGGLGVEMARLHRPDLTLLDLDLPDVSGHDVLRRLKNDPDTKDIPVIMLTADATCGQEQKLRKSGASGYLTKPFEVRQFLEVLDEVLFAA